MSTASAPHRESVRAGETCKNAFFPCGQPALEGLAGARIADVLRLWDTERKTWLETGPVIVRLETCDLAVTALYGNRPSLLIGSIDTETPAGAPWVADSACTSGLVLWRSFRPLSNAIGRRVDRAGALAYERTRKLSVRLSLEEGETLLITGCSNPTAIEIELVRPMFCRGRDAADRMRATAS